MNERTPMWCDICRGSDTDPRHHVMMDDGTIQTRHMDCCRDEGCHDKSCDKILADSSEARGEKLILWIEDSRPLPVTIVVKEDG